MKFKRYLQIILANPAPSAFMLFHRLRRLSRLEYLFLNGYSLYPDFITILITKRCNYNCYMCASANPRYTRRYRGGELSIKELKEIIDQVKPWKPAIYVNGGEPFLRQDLFEFLHYCKKNSLITGLTSNGSFLDRENVQKIIDVRLDFFSVSIDGPEDSHDRKRGFKGAFARATSGLKLLVENRKRLPHLKIASILDCQEIDNSRYVLKLARGLGVDEVCFGNLMFYTPEILREHLSFIAREGFPNQEILGYESKGDRPGEIEKVIPFLKEAKKEKKIAVSFVPSNILDTIRSYYSGGKPSPRSHCLTPFYSAVILPDGGVAPCQDFVVGNLREQSFREIWNCEKMRRFRRLSKKSPLPACFRCGEGQVMKFGD